MKLPKLSVPSGPTTIRSQMSRLVLAVCIPLVIILVVMLSLMVVHTQLYTDLLHNVTTASEFNQDFKSNIDLKMYYYVTGSQYSEGLPIEEVQDAQRLARDLLDTTTNRESRLAIASVLDLCQNLEEKIYQIRDTQDYDERQSQLENNINVLTALIQEFMYDYLYNEAVQLDTLQNQMNQRLFTELVLVFLVTAGLVLMMTRYAVALGRSITQPVIDLCARVEELGGGDLTPREPVKADEYEILTLSQGFEQMAGRLKDLLAETTQKQESLRKMELALLQSQINPHFLYNTMDTIIWLVEAGKNREATEMISNLSNFFRFSLSKGKDVITLAEEGEQVLSYLRIQQARYRDILQYTMDLPEALRRTTLPKLTLQPLVENALYHGIKMKRGMGHIAILARREGDVVVLQVTDDGAGIPPARLEELRRAMEEGDRVGFGLATVHERLRLMFGAPYGLESHSEEGVGTTVCARVPWRGEEETV